MALVSPDVRNPASSGWSWKALGAWTWKQVKREAAGQLLPREGWPQGTQATGLCSKTASHTPVAHLRGREEGDDTHHGQSSAVLMDTSTQCVTEDGTLRTVFLQDDPLATK